MAELSFGDNYCYTMLDEIPFVGGPKDGKHLRYKNPKWNGNRKTPIVRLIKRGKGEYHKYVLELAATEGVTIDGRYVYQGIVRLIENPRKEEV